MRGNLLPASMDSVLELVGEGGCGGGAGAVVVLARGLQGPQRVVPVGFEAVGDQPVIRVDGQVAAAGQVGAVAGAFDVPAAQCIGFGGAGVEFGLHGQGDLERVRGEGLEQQVGDGGVDDGAGDGLAALRTVLDAAGHALVVGNFDAAAGVVAHRHPASAAPADGQALQQRGSFAGGAGGAIGAVRGGIAQQQLLVGLVLVPAEVAGVGVADQRDPLLARHELVALLAVAGRGVRGGGRRRTRRRSGGCAGCAVPASAAAASRPARPCGCRCAPAPGTAARRR